MTTDRTSPHPAETNELTQQLLLAELRRHRRSAGPFTWLAAITLNHRTARRLVAPGQPAPDSVLRLLERAGHVQLTHLPLRMPACDESAGYPSAAAGMIALHARLALASYQTQQELHEHAAALQTIAARLGHVLEHNHHQAAPAVP